MLIEKADSMGYKVHLHVVDIDPAEAARRTFARGQMPPDAHGNRQMVPPDFPLADGHSPRIVFDRIIQQAGQNGKLQGILASASYTDNNVKWGEPPKQTKYRFSQDK